MAEAQDGASDSWGESVHGANVGFDTIDFSDSGAVGEPTLATHEAGDKLFEKAEEELAALVEWLGEQPFEALLPAEHR
jgi:creatinine amidohydrolase